MPLSDQGYLLELLDFLPGRSRSDNSLIRTSSSVTQEMEYLCGATGTNRNLGPQHLHISGNI